MSLETQEDRISASAASASQKRLAACVAVALGAAFAAAVPFAARPLAPVPGFIPVYEAALIALDLITAALLLGQVGFFRSRSLVVLAAGYVFTAALAAMHLLSFPGLFSRTGLLGAGPQTTAWLYMFWLAGFPAFVIAYAVTKNDARRMSIAWGVAGALALAGALTALATAGQEWLPQIMRGNGYSPQMTAVVTSVWVLSVVALGLLWRRRPHSTLDVWLMVVMWAWVCDIALSAVLNAGRFDLGFYAGRASGLLASSVVLLVLLIENARLYLGLRERNESLERARQGALAAERAKSAFLATMSHEIRTPMNGVMGLLELLSLSKLDGEQRTTLSIVRESGRSLLRIIDDILDFSRIEAGKLELHPEAMSVGQLVSRVCDVYSGSASAKGLVVMPFVDRRIHPWLLADALRLQQILNNFASNAIKFTNAGQVSIRAELAEKRAAEDVVRFAVEDTGVGVSEAEAAKLFMPFIQAGGPHEGGSGLGLSICKGLADAMGGTVEFASRPGEGTRVSLTVALRHSQPPALAAQSDIPGSMRAPGEHRAPPSEEEAREAGTLVIVVDDHPVNRMVLLKQLETLGFAATSAGGSLEAIELWNRGGVGMVITDCNMPEMDGYELARHIRDCEARHGHRHVPIVACTANAFAGDSERCLAAGMDDYMAKPVLLDALRAKMRRWLPTAAADPRESASALDPEVMRELSRGDADTARELLQEFWRYNAVDTLALRQALAADDWRGIARAAHRVRGSSASIGAACLANACEELERAARIADAPSVRSAMLRFDHELERLRFRVHAEPEKAS